jgi:hypothetical protein
LKFFKPDFIFSWGGEGLDPFYETTVACWQALNIFPIFANGNAGPNCGSTGHPGSYSDVIGVGATDIFNQLANFSSRGLSTSLVEGFPLKNYKPDVSAPGVNITSTWNTGDIHIYNTIYNK